MDILTFQSNTKPENERGLKNTSCTRFESNQKTSERPTVKGRFFYSGSQKIYIRGVTYGTFRPDENGDQFPPKDTVEKDFRAMAEQGFNTVRTYTIPPVWLLDLAHQSGLWVMLGIPWEQHITFLDNRKTASEILKRNLAQLQTCSGHPALLAYTIGNEIPAPIVRWHGRNKIARFLKSFYKRVKEMDPEGLVTYVNYPTTEFLKLPFLDFVSFNVFLEKKKQLKRYLGRLHNLAKDKPLILTEVGLDSQRHGEKAQAKSLGWQIKTAFETGCAGVFAFSWTDEWYRGGNDIEDWDFGLTRRDRSPKPALKKVRKAMANAPVGNIKSWPRITVAVCSYNGGKTIRDTMTGLQNLEYPNYEVIVVNDGSTDNLEAIASEYDCKLISTENRGLSSARNTAYENATGEIVAYIDDDAYPDPHWLHYIAQAFMTRNIQAVGGPNIMPLEDGFFAECIANSPGGPTHVLFSDHDAEHIPGCNMAFRKSCLEELQGFDEQFRTAGDDVDICWRVMERGWKIGFHPSALVWHHRRSTLRRYWKQQKGYGKAEALLEKKWPEKYNRAGHIPWSGRIYGKGLTKSLFSPKERIYQGTWGLAPFQSVYQQTHTLFSLIPLTPEWFLTSLFLAGLSALSLFWKPLLVAVPLLALSLVAPVGQAIKSALKAPLNPKRPRWKRCLSRTTIALLHVIQPAARLTGRIGNGLTIWRRRGPNPKSWSACKNSHIWSENWHEPEKWLGDLESSIKDQGASFLRGSDYDRWDLEIFSGLFGSIRVLMAIEEHGSGKQLIRFNIRPRLSWYKLSITAISVLLSVGALLSQAWIPGAILSTGTLGLLFKQKKDTMSAMTTLTEAIKTAEEILGKPTEEKQIVESAEAPSEIKHEVA